MATPPGAGREAATAAAQGFGGIDGSVVPYAAAGSLPFLPAECLRVLRALKIATASMPGGATASATPSTPTPSGTTPMCSGIDLGIGLLMAENLRTGFVWETFARNPEVGIAMQRAGFHAI